MSSPIDILRQFGIRPSHQRITVLEYLLKHQEHNSADEIFEGLKTEMPMLSRTTVYNTVRLFQNAGVVHTLSIGSAPTCFDADLTPHAHFYCRECHAIIDLPVMDTDWNRMRAYAGHDDEVEMQVLYKGICEKCRMHS